MLGLLPFLLEHPQDLVFPCFTENALTSNSKPQSHLTLQIAFLLSSFPT